MILLLLALMTDAPATQEAQATLQSCEMTANGWVCHYAMPSVTLLVAPDKTIPISPTPPTLAVLQPAGEVDKAEAARQARLIARCAEATWKSLCLPGDRREAKRLKEEATKRDALRGQVTTLLSEKKCEEAVRVALAAGDLPLAREARAFCAN
jgi:hypothetical protein